MLDIAYLALLLASLAACVELLAWLIRSEPAVPATESGDRR